MAHLDRFLSAMIQHSADSLQLREGEVVRLDIRGATHAVTKEPLSSGQIVTLLREISPPDAEQQLNAKQAVSFCYATDEAEFVVHASQLAGQWAASVLRSAGNGVPAPTSVGDGATVRLSGAAVKQDGVDESALARINELLRLLVEGGASDLHLRVGEPPVVRRSGEMERLTDHPPFANETLTAMLMAIMPERNKREFAELNDTDFAYEIEGLSRFRANALLDRKGVAAVFRAIPTKIVTVEEMGITPEVQNLCYLTKGLVLVTGPTGSGKSTTLAAMVDLVNRARTDHVITIEDPIEFVHNSKSCIITQRQVGVHTTSFKHALRAALREDPDIVLVGELRDLETVAIAIETAETGHLVFGTLHTTTAPSTIDRLIDQFPADRQAQIRVMLSESLKGVISQTLCKKIGGGRVAAREILLTTPALSNLIREGKTYQIPSILQTSKRLGMITLNDALMEHVDAGNVEPKEAYMKAVDKIGFVNQLRSRGHSVSFAEAGMSADAPQTPSPPPQKSGSPAR